MRLYFTDPNGGKLAIDTKRREYCADFITPETVIGDNHRFINVASVQDLEIVLKEAEFCSWSYSGAFLEDRLFAYMARDIEHLIEKGRSLIGSFPDDQEDITVSEMKHFIERARETDKTESLIYAISEAYYMGMGVGYQHAKDESPSLHE